MPALTSGVRDDLPSDITVSYGSLTLPTNLLITGFHTTPIWDRAGRTITALTHRAALKFWLNSFDANNPGNSLDNSPTVNVPSIRTQLLKPADQLILLNTAFGNYVINPTAAAIEGLAGEKIAYDVNWGPKTIHFAQKPHSKYGSEIDWTVEFQINACTDLAQPNNILEFNYSADWTYDQSGYCTRTYKGSLTIPMTRKSVNDRTLPLLTVDSFREKVTPLLAIGFRRTTYQWSLSEDKRSLTFTIVDAQMPPNIPPEGCVIADSSHSIENDFKDIQTRSMQTIRASYELTSDRARAEAFLHFQALVKDRTALATKKGLTIIPIRIHISEPEIYGRKAAEFSLAYYVLHTLAKKRNTRVEWPPQTLLQDSGIWRPVPGNSWNNWSKSLVASKVMTPRGTSDMRWSSAEDAIVDLCATTQPVPPVEVPSSRKLAPSIRVAASSFEKVDPLDSFLRYELVLEIQVLDNTVVLQTLPTDPIAYDPPVLKTNAYVGYVQPYPDVPDSIVQFRGAPKYVLKMYGRCLRAAYDVTPPQIVSFGSQTPVPFNDASCYFRSAVVANYGVPIVGATWRFQYLLASVPSESFVAPANPIYGGTAQDQAETRELKGGVAR